MSERSDDITIVSNNSNSKNDELLLDLLNQLATYDSLLEQLQRSFSDGFINLSRANYYNKDTLRGKYGMDYYDESYPGQILVNIDDAANDDFDIVYKEEKITQDVHNESIASNNLLSAVEKSETNFKSRRDKSSVSKEKKRESRVKDPIQMFGAGLTVPSSLRQAQSKFKSSLPTIIDLVNCKRRIDKIVKQYARAIGQI